MSYLKKLTATNSATSVCFKTPHQFLYHSVQIVQLDFTHFQPQKQALSRCWLEQENNGRKKTSLLNQLRMKELLHKGCLNMEVTSNRHLPIMQDLWEILHT